MTIDYRNTYFIGNQPMVSQVFEGTRLKTQDQEFHQRVVNCYANRLQNLEFLFSFGLNYDPKPAFENSILLRLIFKVELTKF